MQYVLNEKQIRTAEDEFITSGFTRESLSLNAAMFSAEEIERYNDNKIAVFCGMGGNGEDGLLAAMIMFRHNKRVSIYIVGESISERINRLKVSAERLGMGVFNARDYDGSAEIIVDAIFGIGLNRPIEGLTATLIEKLNSQNALKIALDIPSGLNCNTGYIMGTAFCADITLTFSCYKVGMLFNDGKRLCGKVKVLDIGVDVKSGLKIYETTDFKPYRRRVDSHKGLAGRVCIIGGSGDMVGAPIIAGAAAHAAYLNGAGLVTVCMPQIFRAALASRTTLNMMDFMPCDSDGNILFDSEIFARIAQTADSIDIGMGMGKDAQTKRIIKYFVDNFDGNLILDADALNAIAGDYQFLKNARAKIILTPHVGEFVRLTGYEPTIEGAEKLAKEVNGVIALKSATTIITDGEETRINITGTPAMAKGGTGDLLAGCIAALSCSFLPLDAVTVACYRNGKGAEKAVSNYAEFMLTPNDILKYSDYEELKR